MDLDDGGEVVVSRRLLDHRHLIAALAAVYADRYSLLRKWCGEAVISGGLLIAFDSTLVERQAANDQLHLVVDLALPKDLARGRFGLSLGGRNGKQSE